jgi:hypothetical protein
MGIGSNGLPHSPANSRNFSCNARASRLPAFLPDFVGTGQVTLSVSDSKSEFFMELVRSLDFVQVEDVNPRGVE